MARPITILTAAENWTIAKTVMMSRPVKRHRQNASGTGTSQV